MKDTAASPRPWIELRPSRGWRPRVRPRELWAYREVAFFLALRDLKVMYKQTFFGVLWGLIQPLAGAAVFTVVFGQLTNLPSDGIPYAVFVYAGMVIWTYHARAVEHAATELVANSELLTQVYFPRLLAPLAAVLPSLVGVVVSLVLLACFMAAYGVAPSAALLTLPVWIGAAVAVALGAGCLLGALNVRYRDVGNGLTFLLQLWLFLSPVIYPSSLLEGAWRWLLSVNPMTGVIDGFRWAATDAPAPPAADLVSLATGLLLVAAGLAYFQRAERSFADVI